MSCRRAVLRVFRHTLNLTMLEGHSHADFRRQRPCLRFAAGERLDGRLRALAGGDRDGACVSSGACSCLR